MYKYQNCSESSHNYSQMYYIVSFSIIQKFTSSTSKINHERSHTGEKPFHCDICWKVKFPSQFQIKNQKKTKKNHNLFLPGEIIKTFATRYLLRAHKMKEHSSPSKIRPFKERTLNRDVRGKVICYRIIL